MQRARSNTKDDSDRIKDALQKIKSENRKLRKENSQLRKQLSRVSETEFENTVDLEEEDLPVFTEKKEVLNLNCPKCKSEDFKEVRAGRYLIKVCNECRYRKRVDLEGKKAN